MDIRVASINSLAYNQPMPYTRKQPMAYADRQTLAPACIPSNVVVLKAQGQLSPKSQATMFLSEMTTMNWATKSKRSGIASQRQGTIVLPRPPQFRGVSRTRQEKLLA
eukprot:6213730-Pleurochrysis_carterae.AAC.1